MDGEVWATFERFLVSHGGALMEVASSPARTEGYGVTLTTPVETPVRVLPRVSLVLGSSQGTPVIPRPTPMESSNTDQDPIFIGTVTKETSLGGLGIPSLPLLNRAIMGKILWEVDTRREGSIWVQPVYLFRLYHASVWSMSVQQGSWDGVPEVPNGDGYSSSAFSLVGSGSRQVAVAVEQEASFPGRNYCSAPTPTMRLESRVLELAVGGIFR
ncbi:hypothetical protein Salat_2084100 [Sesamum alatum]|uniref:Uncharacterized protein n=1 Tax=Sesamum alatum TaxID=300844 RepID=A0AAE1Y149_9LAMI|nr:hypothetical protein Salat_2084100 [Sesamum alatum]